MMPQLLEVAPDAVYVIVTNPCDVLTVLAQEATALPPERIFASGTVLDTSRLRWKLAERAGVSTSSVHAYIVGEHGDTEFPMWSKATIGTVPILDWVDARTSPDDCRTSSTRSPSTCAMPRTRSSWARARRTTRSDSRARASSRRS